MSDPDHHAETEEHVCYGKQIQDLHVEIEQLRGKVYLATGFLEGMADRLDAWTRDKHVLPTYQAAADCRAMAARLRGEI